jgi:PncC family amidohydrolase
MRLVKSINASARVFRPKEKRVDEPLEVQIGNFLRSRGLLLATAESCSGGLMGHRITNIPGSSDYYPGGVIAYANAAKVSLLGVSWNTLNTFGAVSRETVVEMARGVCSALGADLGVSISGIAGPGGGMPGKPVGTVWIGLCASGGQWARVFAFSSDREHNKSQAVEAGFQMALEYLQGERQLNADMRQKGFL